MGGSIRRFLIVVTTITLALALGGPSTAEGPDYSWPPDGKEYWSGEGNIGFIIMNKIVANASFISAQVLGSIPPSCATLDDPACADPAQEFGWHIWRAAPVCSEALNWEECIQGLSFARPGLPALPAEHLGYRGIMTFEADPARGLPTGASMSLWSDPLSSDPTQGYGVNLGGIMTKPPGSDLTSGDPFRFDFFGAQVFRYRTASVANHDLTDCVWYDATRCAVQIPFDDDAVPSLSFLMNRDITGWLSGRLSEPSVDIQPASGNLNQVTVTAKPVELAMAAATVPVNEATPEMLDLWSRFLPGSPKDTVIYVNSDQDGLTFELLKAFTRPAKDTALKVIPTWSISSIAGNLSECTQDDRRLIGLVTTNSTAYSSGPPTFTDGALKYSVAAWHQAPSGQAFRGSYDLIMRSDTARCLYGLGRAPIRGEIQVTSENGQEQVATTSVSERDGWVHLAAYNFTFSSPTITAKLTTSKPGKTILCKKGTKTKKVTGVRPKCPPGWRQVRGSSSARL